MRSGLPTSSLPRCREVGSTVVRSGLPTSSFPRFCWVLSEVYYLKYLWLLYFHGYFYDMMVICIYAKSYVVKQIQVLRFLKIVTANF